MSGVRVALACCGAHPSRGGGAPVKRIFSCIFAPLAAALSISLLAAAAPPTEQEIAQAIEELGAPEFETRQAASALLWRAGNAAEMALQRAAESTDAEVRTRAGELVIKLRLGIRPDTPADVIGLIEQFRHGQSTEQRQEAL